MRKMGVTKQLALFFGAFCAITVLSLAALSVVFQTSWSTSRKLAERTATQNRTLFALQDSLADFQSVLQKFVREKDPDRLEELVKVRDAAIAKARENVQGADGGTGALAEPFQALVAANERAVTQVLQGNLADGIQIAIEESDPAYEALRSRARQLRNDAERTLQETTRAAAARTSRLQALIYTLVIAALSVVMVFSFVLVRQIGRKLKRAVRELHHAVTEIANAANQVSGASRSLSDSTGQQAASLEETAASCQEISSLTESNANNSRSAADCMGRTAQVIADANAKLQTMAAAMNEIRNSSEKVSKIIKVIDEIAFQTNILALNAAVEAARAGEAGMGFAVVAGEVRNLAQRSAQAARDTTQLIEDAITKTVDGHGRVGGVLEAIQAVNENASRAKVLIEEVSTGSQEQARGIEQVSRAMTQLEPVTQRTAAGAQESAAAGEELTAQAKALTEVVEALDVMVGGV